MKVLAVISCIFAVAAASWPVANVHHHGAVIGAHGVPLEPAANVAARAFHHAAHAEATARNSAAGAWAGDAHGWAGDAHGWAGDAHGLAGNWAGNWAGHGAYAGHYASGHHYAGPQHLAVIGANGVPVDTPANNARRAFHHAAHSEAVARNGDAYGHGAWGYAAHAAPVAWAGHAAHAVPVIGHNGVPIDTPEVAAAKSAHFAAHAAAAHGHGYGHGHGHAW